MSSPKIFASLLVLFIPFYLPQFFSSSIPSFIVISLFSSLSIPHTLLSHLSFLFPFILFLTPLPFHSPFHLSVISLCLPSPPLPIHVSLLPLRRFPPLLSVPRFHFPAWVPLVISLSLATLYFPCLSTHPPLSPSYVTLPSFPLPTLPFLPCLILQPPSIRLGLMWEMYGRVLL